MRNRIDRGPAARRRVGRLASVACLLAGIAAIGMAWAGPWKVGDRVIVKATGSIGTVIAVGRGTVDVKEDRFATGSIMYDDTNVVAASAPAAPAPAATTAAGGHWRVGDRVVVKATGSLGTVVSVDRSMVTVHEDKYPIGTILYDNANVMAAPPGSPPAPVIREPSTPPPAPAGRPLPNVDGGERDPNLPGLIYPTASGMPPPGHYTVDKISGSHEIHVGWLDISGSHFSGVAGGAGGTMTLNGRNRIVWHGRITGIDPGAVLHDGVYQAPSSLTNFKPIVRIYYTNPNGATEVMDATLEK